MKSLERRFLKFEKKNPWWPPLICFSAAVAGQRFSFDRLARWFNKLVPEDEYSCDPEAKKEWVAHFMWRTNTTGEGSFVTDAELDEESEPHLKNTLKRTKNDWLERLRQRRNGFTASRPHIWRKGPNGERIAYWEEKKYIDDN